jgi:putative ABC transport system permease protein
VERWNDPGRTRAAIGLALATVREHKMRSFLTVLGVIIGTGTIIGVGLHHRRDGRRGHRTSSAALEPTQPSSSNFRSGSDNVTAEMLRRKPITYEDGVAIAAALSLSAVREPLS